MLDDEEKKHGYCVVGLIWTPPPAISRDGWSAGLRRLRPGISGGVLAERAGPEASAPVAVSRCVLPGDRDIGTQLACLLCGGDLTSLHFVAGQSILDMEREGLPEPLR
jgi:hypothetical protein